MCVGHTLYWVMLGSPEEPGPSLPFQSSRLPELWQPSLAPGHTNFDTVFEESWALSLLLWANSRTLPFSVAWLAASNTGVREFGIQGPVHPQGRPAASPPAPQSPHL